MVPYDVCMTDCHEVIEIVLLIQGAKCCVMFVCLQAGRSGTETTQLNTRLVSITSTHTTTNSLCYLTTPDNVAGLDMQGPITPDKVAELDMQGPHHS